MRRRRRQCTPLRAPRSVPSDSVLHRYILSCAHNFYYDTFFFYNYFENIIHCCFYTLLIIIYLYISSDVLKNEKSSYSLISNEVGCSTTMIVWLHSLSRNNHNYTVLDMLFNRRYDILFKTFHFSFCCFLCRSNCNAIFS